MSRYIQIGQIYYRGFFYYNQKSHAGLWIKKSRESTGHGLYVINIESICPVITTISFQRAEEILMACIKCINTMTDSEEKAGIDIYRNMGGGYLYTEKYYKQPGTTITLATQIKQNDALNLLPPDTDYQIPFYATTQKQSLRSTKEYAVDKARLLARTQLITPPAEEKPDEIERDIGKPIVCVNKTKIKDIKIKQKKE